MRKSIRVIAEEMGLQPISILAALKLMLKGKRPGFCCGFRTKHGIHVWKTK